MVGGHLLRHTVSPRSTLDTRSLSPGLFSMPPEEPQVFRFLPCPLPFSFCASSWDSHRAFSSALCHSLWLSLHDTPPQLKQILPTPTNTLPGRLICFLPKLLHLRLAHPAAEQARTPGLPPPSPPSKKLRLPSEYLQIPTLGKNQHKIQPRSEQSANTRKHGQENIAVNFHNRAFRQLTLRHETQKHKHNKNR